MTIRSLFTTPLYQADLDDAAPVEALAHALAVLAKEDRAGINWSRDHGYKGYTSYASLNDLPQRDPDIAALVKLIDRHVARFADLAGMELHKKLRLDSLWVNVMQPGAHHSGHIHPHSVISGTFYVAIPDGAGGISFEDPRLPMLMAAPLRRANADESQQSFVTIQPHVGMLLLWESWLRHGVLPHQGKGQRLSISFNYA